MSENLDLVRSIFADWERGDFSRADWAHPECEYVVVGGPEPGSWTGLAGMAEAVRGTLSAWEEYGIEAAKCRELDGERVLVFTRASGRGKASALDVGQIRAEGTDLFHISHGKVTRLVLYADRERALADLGLEAQAMPDESTTPDPAELVRKQLEALDRGDLDGVMSSVAEDVVLDGRVESLEGRAAIRGFLEEWFRAYEELDFELEEVSHLGGGVVFAVVIQDGRPVGGDGHVRQREGWVYLCMGGSIARLTTSEVDQARLAAERLAKERG